MAAVIMGVVIGVVTFAVLMILVACVCCSRRRKKKPHPMNIPFYTDEKGNVHYYQNAGMPPPWQQHPSNNGHMPPPPWPQYPSNNGYIPPPLAPLSGEMGPCSSGPHGPPLPTPSPDVALGFSKSSFSYEELAAATSGFSPATSWGRACSGTCTGGCSPALGRASESSRRRWRYQPRPPPPPGVPRRLLRRRQPAPARLRVRPQQHPGAPPPRQWRRRRRTCWAGRRGTRSRSAPPRASPTSTRTATLASSTATSRRPTSSSTPTSRPCADFGLAKLTTDTNTHVSTRVMGTFGYLAPEYASSGKLTDRSDVFSFGVMLLELITGRRPIDHMEADSLVDWARPVLARVLASEVGYEELVDARLEGEYSQVEVEWMAASAAACVRHSGSWRPRMSQIVRDDLHMAGLDPSVVQVVQRHVPLQRTALHM